MPARWTEERVVDLIRERLAKIVAPGARALVDDGAWLPDVSSCSTRVISCDAFQEGNDFLLSIASPQSAGYRAIIQNLSDMAAMGASPVGFVWSLEIPKQWLQKNGARLSLFCDGAAQACHESTLRFYGGDLSFSSDKFSCSITIFGDVAGQPNSRQGAKPGDSIFVSRPLGLSSYGLEILLKNLRTRHRAPLSTNESAAVAAHLWPKAEVALGKRLVGVATSGMDISDGLARDLHRLCKASGVGAELDSLQSAIHPQITVPNAKEYALYGGEDFALLFTASPQQKIDKHSIRIGTITDQKSVVCEKIGRRTIRIKPLGYDHFTSRT